jgi:AAA domain-containing protein
MACRQLRIPSQDRTFLYGAGRARTGASAMTEVQHRFEIELRFCQQLLAGIGPDVRWKIFKDVANNLARFVCRGVEKPTVVDALADCAKTYVINSGGNEVERQRDEDDAQTMMSEAIAEAEQQERITDDLLLDQHNTKQQSNGQQKANAGKQRFTLKRFEDIRLSTEPNYLVKGILPRTGLAVVWGPPKCGKSFWTFDLLMHVALDWKYRGRRVQQGPVVYLALEGGHGFAARVEAWRRHHLADHEGTVPFFLLDVPVDLVADRDKLIATIREQLGGQVPAAVAIDTLNRALIGDENKSDDMAKFIRAADLIRATFGCLVVIVHHCGIQGGRPRGHTSLSGADDVQIAVERDAADNIVCRVEHMKDGEAGAALVSQLDRVELGQDKDGDQITSCIITPVEGGAVAKGAKLTATTKLELDQLQELIADCGEVPPASNHIPPSIRVCSAALWREQFYEACLGDKRDTKKKAFGRAVSRLQELNIIGVWSDKVWLAGQAGQAAGRATTGRHQVDQVDGG